MAPRIEDYPLKATSDARTAMAGALLEFVLKFRFSAPRSLETFGFEFATDTWAKFEERAMSAGGKLPAVAVLPDNPVYESSGLTPRAIEETWSGGDPNECDESGRSLHPLGDGSGDGFVLHTVRDLVVPFVLVVRARSRPERKAIVKRFEEVFLEDGSISPDDPPKEVDGPPVRDGIVIEVPSYYRRKARFTLLSQQLMDSAVSARENRWIAQIEIEGQMQVCTIRRGRAMSPRVRVSVDGELDLRT